MNDWIQKCQKKIGRNGCLRCKNCLDTLYWWRNLRCSPLLTIYTHKLPLNEGFVSKNYLHCGKCSEVIGWVFYPCFILEVTNLLVSNHKRQWTLQNWKELVTQPGEKKLLFRWESLVSLVMRDGWYDLPKEKV